MRKTVVPILCILLAVSVLRACDSKPEPAVAVPESSGLSQVLPERAEVLAWAIPKGTCPFTFTANCRATGSIGTTNTYATTGTASPGGTVTAYVWAYTGSTAYCIAVIRTGVGSSGSYSLSFAVDRLAYAGRIDVDVVAADPKGRNCLSACDKLEP